MRYAQKLMTAMLMLSLLALTACSQKSVIVLDKAKTVKIEQGEAAPWAGWLLTDGAVVELLECCDRSLE